MQEMPPCKQQTRSSKADERGHRNDRSNDLYVYDELYKAETGSSVAMSDGQQLRLVMRFMFMTLASLLCDVN
jgi:hypothetical protein